MLQHVRVHALHGGHDGGWKQCSCSAPMAQRSSLLFLGIAAAQVAPKTSRPLLPCKWVARQLVPASAKAADLSGKGFCLRPEHQLNCCTGARRATHGVTARGAAPKRPPFAHRLQTCLACTCLSSPRLPAQPGAAAAPAAAAAACSPPATQRQFPAQPPRPAPPSSLPLLQAHIQSKCDLKSGPARLLQSLHWRCLRRWRQLPLCPMPPCKPGQPPTLRPRHTAWTPGAASQ